LLPKAQNTVDLIRLTAEPRIACVGDRRSVRGTVDNSRLAQITNVA